MQNGKEFLKEYGLLTLGTIGIVVSDYFFKFPNHFSFGGVTGIAVLLSGILGGNAAFQRRAGSDTIRDSF